MKTEHKELLESLGYKIRGSYIFEYIDSSKEPKQYWNNRPKTVDFQIFGWQIVAHESKVEMFLNSITKTNKL